MKNNVLLFICALLVQGNTFAKESKRLAVVIPSYCNALWYEKNLDSLLEQDYSNWYAIYIDDCSPDGTADLVKSYIERKGLQDKIRLIANTERKGALANHYIATHLCDDWDIVLQYDGDDWFPRTDVLSMIAQEYNDPNVWLTYGSFEDWPTGKRGYSRPTPPEVVENRLYRETYWTPGQLRTFYAWVFKNVRLEDFLWEHDDEHRGKFYPASCDLAFSYPMMEMVGTHFKYIDVVIYIHNVQTPINDFKVNRVPQIIASNVLLYKRKYEPVKVPPARTRAPFKGVDVMVVTHDGLDNCQQTIDSCLQNLTGIAQLYVLDVKNDAVGVYNDGHIVKNNEIYANTKHLLVKEMHNWWKAAEHMFFVENGLIVNQQLDLSYLAQKVDESQAFGFFPSLGIQNYDEAPSIHLDEGVFVWKLSAASPDWMLGSNKLCVLGRKEKIRERIAYLTEELVDEVFLHDIFGQGMLLIKDPTISRIGLSFEKPVVIE